MLPWIVLFRKYEETKTSLYLLRAVLLDDWERKKYVLFLFLFLSESRAIPVFPADFLSVWLPFKGCTVTFTQIKGPRLCKATVIRPLGTLNIYNPFHSSPLSIFDDVSLKHITRIPLRESLKSIGYIFCGPWKSKQCKVSVWAEVVDKDSLP